MKKLLFIVLMGLSALSPVLVSAATSSIRTDAFDQLGAAAGSNGAGDRKSVV